MKLSPWFLSGVAKKDGTDCSFRTCVKHVEPCETQKEGICFKYLLMKPFDMLKTALCSFGSKLSRYFFPLADN